MVTYEKGNVLEFFKSGEVNAVLHCCNCRGVMGSGVALQIKNKFPEAYNSYKKYEAERTLKLGTISMACFQNGFIYNLHAQKDYGVGTRQVNYEALYECLELVKHDLKMNNFCGVIGVPCKMASDRAGGNWKIVECMIREVFENFNVIVVDYNR